MDDRQHITILHASGETVEYIIVDQDQHSATVTSMCPTYPTTEEINLPGEVAICTLDGYESMHVKNTDNEIVSWEDDSVRDKKLANWVSHNGGLVANDLVRSTNGMLSVTEGAQMTDRVTLFKAKYDKRERVYNYAYLRITGQQTGKYGTRENGMVTDMDKISDELATDLTAYTNFVITLVNYPESGKTYNVTIVHQNEVIGTPMVKGGDYNALICHNILGLEGLDKQNPITVSEVTCSLPPAYLSVASGVGSHAEGSATSANTTGAHAEGNNTKTYGDYAHVEGMDGAASGIGSSSHNAQCYSNGGYSSTYGYVTYADEQGEFACGAANQTKDAIDYNWVDRIFSVGDGLCNMAQTAGDTLLTAPHDYTAHNALTVSKIEDGYDSSDGKHALTISLLPENILITAEVRIGQTETHDLKYWLNYAKFFIHI